jgi:tetratricopeptide (TPR) repeat protein
VQRSNPQVAGSSAEQQERANILFGELARDSNSVTTHHALADVLYDTGNWSEAVVHYRAAIRRDSSLVNALVDLGVCYYNLGDGAEAQRQFELALVREPAQPVALFNLGIVFEARGENERALEFYHRAMQANPPAEMRQPLTQRIDALAQKLGKPAPAGPGGK